MIFLQYQNKKVCLLTQFSATVLIKTAYSCPLAIVYLFSQTFCVTNRVPAIKQFKHGIRTFNRSIKKFYNFTICYRYQNLSRQIQLSPFWLPIKITHTKRIYFMQEKYCQLKINKKG